MNVVVSYASLCLAQAIAVALPGRPPRLPAFLRSGAFALVPPLVIAVVVVALVADPDLANRLATLAGVAVPPLALAAPALVDRRARLACVAALVPALPGAFLLSEGGLPSEICRVTLIVLACVTLGDLLAAAAPPILMKLAIVAFTIVDVILVLGHQVEKATHALRHAQPAAGLPHFQDAILGHASFGFGDLFLAAVLGGVLARTGGARGVAAAVTGVGGALFGLLLLRTDLLPATVPVLLGLVAAEVVDRAQPARLSGAAASTSSRL